MKCGYVFLAMNVSFSAEEQFKTVTVPTQDLAKSNSTCGPGKKVLMYSVKFITSLIKNLLPKPISDKQYNNATTGLECINQLKLKKDGTTEVRQETQALALFQVKSTWN